MKSTIGLIAVASMCVLGCAHAPTKAGERADLVKDAQQTLARMEAKDPGLRSVLDNSAGYIVFPAVGSGGFIVGGGGGKGVVFEGGRQAGFATIERLSVGALAGGQRYSQLIVVKDPKVLQDMKDGRFDFGAHASAVILKTGAATATTFANGVAVFVDPVRGAMVNASLGGQRIRMTM